jgi:hypothetical protein
VHRYLNTQVVSWKERDPIEAIIISVYRGTGGAEPTAAAEDEAWPFGSARLPVTDAERAARLDQYSRATETVLRMVNWHGVELR